jgi:catechol 2,3-dioxygenase-like lactoylglutathione lyase family enzyme
MIPPVSDLDASVGFYRDVLGLEYEGRTTRSPSSGSPTS